MPAVPPTAQPPAPLGRDLRDPSLANFAGQQFALPDTADPADRNFVPEAGAIPDQVTVEAYQALGLPIMDQGDEFACTGFALAAVANYLIAKRMGVRQEPVSPRMLYEMAKHYDGSPDAAHDGSSARGALLGWEKHGVCADQLWPFIADKPDPTLTPERQADAAKRPLLSYERVCEERVADVRAAIAQRGIVYVTAQVHAGWKQVGADGMIPDSFDIDAVHAFVLVAYDQDGFWLQNSKGRSWGKGGLGYIGFADWAGNAVDAWVATLGALAPDV